MKNKVFKLISCLLMFGIIFSFSFVFADQDKHVGEETVIKNIANRVLDIVMWFAYALALGSLIFFGIKYLLSGANEKANLKGMLPKYLIGLVAILLCFTIASFVAGIAEGDPADDPAKEIIEVGEEAGNYFDGSGGGATKGETTGEGTTGGGTTGGGGIFNGISDVFSEQATVHE